MRHLMSPLDFSVEELDKLLTLAQDIEGNPQKYAPRLRWEKACHLVLRAQHPHETEP